MLEVSDLCCVRGEKPLFSGLDFCLGAGELLYLQGRNGSGKTSLLRILNGLLPAAGGEIRCAEEISKDISDRVTINSAEARLWAKSGFLSWKDFQRDSRRHFQKISSGSQAFRKAWLHLLRRSPPGFYGPLLRSD